MCFAGMLAAVAAAAGDVGPSSTESATDARTLLLCEAYVRFCAATLGTHAGEAHGWRSGPGSHTGLRSGAQGAAVGPGGAGR